ncbi:MAG: translocation/assembly module TamB domain-containing protein, partial [Candidatus Omnitrophica bacterium]|nr:translocation/assembly module TamB domain-containing protein [Candidatus Omnitrophota bacterium]
MQRRIQRLDIQRPRLILGATEIALETAHIGDMLELRCPVQRVGLDELMGWLNVPSEVMVDGPIELEGRWSFRGFRSHQLRLSARGEGLRVRWDPHLNAHANLALTLTEPLASPTLNGVLDVTSAAWSGTGVHPVGTALGKDEPIVLRWADRFPGTIQLHLNGANLRVQTDQLHAQLQAALKLQKDSGQPTRLVGTLQASDGTYTVKGLEFRIVNGTIRFAERPEASPELNAVLETRAKRYHIRVAVSGTLAESQMRVSSRPELPREDILALLAFGRPVAALTHEERRTLSGRDEAAQALDLLLLGRAELLAARWLGLDEINVNVAPSATTSMQAGGSPIESVEVGKYVIPERLFGSYKLEPPQALTEMPRHTVSAALHLTENLSLEGAVTAKVQEAQEPTADSIDAPQQRLQAEEAF